MADFFAVALAVGICLHCSWCTANTTWSTPIEDTTTVIADRTSTVGLEGRSCNSDEDCQTDDFFCDRDREVCECKAAYTTVSLSTPVRCLPAKQLGEACEEDAQCRLLDQHAVCTKGYCACDSGFYQLHEENGTLCDPNGVATTAVVPSPKMDANMIVVICVLAIMFTGICVALHLFSRARFRNRRTIFNSPHPRLMHIKLGKKKKKKHPGSHLPTPLHHPIVPRHHSFSGNHIPSPLPMNRITKTRSHSHECLRSAVRRDSSPKLEMRIPPRAPLAERESSSVPSTEDLDKKTPDLVQPNGMVLDLDDRPSSSPTVIITDADGSHHQVVSTSHTSLTNGNAVNV